MTKLQVALDSDLDSALSILEQVRIIIKLRD